MMGKKLISLSAVTLFALSLTFLGCGEKEEPAPPPPPPAAPAEPAPPAMPSEPSKDAGSMPEKTEEKKDEAKTN